MESKIPNEKTFVVPKGPITFLMTKNGPIMIVTKNNQLPSQKALDETQQTLKKLKSQAVIAKPISEISGTKEQMNVKINKVNTKETTNILTAAATERSKSMRAKTLIDSLEQTGTTRNILTTTETERSQSMRAKTDIDNVKKFRTDGNILTAAETERSKSLRAKRLIDSLQPIERVGNVNFEADTNDSGIEYIKKKSQQIRNKKQYMTPNVTVKESKNKNKHYACHKCGESFEKIDSMMKHFAIHRNEKSSTPLSRKGKALPDKSSKKDIKHNLSEKKKKCSICDYIIKDSESMEIHMKIHEKMIQKPFSCDTCTEKFISNLELMDHIKTHTGEKVFSCLNCKQKFTQKQSLLSHLLSHTGEKPFSCTICKKKFATEKYLNNHKAKHIEGENNCPICQRVLSTKQAMKIHIKTHDYDKFEGKYVCGVCEMSFHSKDDLLHHLSNHTENFEPDEIFEESFLCPYCEEIFILREDLLKHFEDVHA
ncbi:unnamed protein product [Meganyctiphanes norvegica]|uniref:C2H2-type domain-containing protein n=1 Tax=Meganyctiphanes norvegica TaxID=48144 RepID=A0AAV2SDT2_MEGNR